MPKLNVEDAQLLADHRDVIKACEKVLEQCVNFHLSRLATIDISKSDAIHDLLIAKARLDGMRSLVTDFSATCLREIRR